MPTRIRKEPARIRPNVRYTEIVGFGVASAKEIPRGRAASTTSLRRLDRTTGPASFPHPRPTPTANGPVDGPDLRGLGQARPSGRVEKQTGRDDIAKRLVELQDECRAKVKSSRT